MHNRVFLAFDFGLRRIGLAVGQTVTCSATPLPVIWANNGVPDWTAVGAVIKYWHPHELIVGLPISMNESELSITQAARHFSKQLEERFSLTVHLVDERLTTKEARSVLFEYGGAKMLKKNGQIDGYAACLILQQWFSQMAPE